MSRFVLGEFTRALDDRYRISIPAELADSLPAAPDGGCILAKERPGALSLWDKDDWGQRLDNDVSLIRSKVEAGHLKHRTPDIQLLGRLLSTRHREVQIAGRGRISIPDGFRNFLGVEPGENVMLIGAALCIEIWRPEKWAEYLQDHIPRFGQLIDELAK